jgi:hypothetical protein
MTELFTEELYTAELSNGARGKMSFAVYNDDALLAFDILGAEQVVKAFRASVLRQAQITSDVGAYAATYETLEYRIEKQLVFRAPPLHRWLFYPAPPAAAPARVIFGFENLPPGPALRAVLQETHYPTWPGCGAALLELGLHMGKIQSLSHTANVAFAYLVLLTDWLDVYGRGLDTGQLDIATLQAALRGDDPPVDARPPEIRALTRQTN